MPKLSFRQHLYNLRDQYAAYVEGDADPTGAYDVALTVIEHTLESTRRITYENVFTIWRTIQVIPKGERGMPDDKRETLKAIEQTLATILWPEKAND